MSLKTKINTLFHNPRRVLVRSLESASFLFKEDSECYLQLRFLVNGGYRLNLKNPQTFNEKLNWMKLHYHHPQLPLMADKYAVKQFVADRIGREYVVENLGVWNASAEIDFDSLPKKFVLKCTHDSGGVFICKDKSCFDREGVCREIDRKLSRNYSSPGRQWVYKDIPPRVLADKFLEDGNDAAAVNLDYKFWCFGGVPRLMYITIKDEQVFENFYDMDFQPVNIDHGFERHKPEFQKPESFELMRELAAKLSSGIPFVRVDFFEIGGQPYFGEFTFYDWGGLRPFRSYAQDLELGGLIHLPL